jgi:hypothetical protein
MAAKKSIINRQSPPPRVWSAKYFIEDQFKLPASSIIFPSKVSPLALPPKFAQAMADKLSQNQLEATFELVKDFVVRFIGHVDPEANQVKSTFSLSRIIGARILGILMVS